jgi:hypothetical protein
MTDNHNNHENNDKIIHELYNKGDRDIPPGSIDNIILNRAKSSCQIPASRNKWRPWLAAASVVFAIPMIWYITQNNELIEYQTPIPSVVAPKTIEQAPDLTEEAMPANEVAKPVASKPYAAPAIVDMVAQEQDGATEAEKSSENGNLINQSSLEANRQLLKNELKAKKRTIKPSNLDPMMALELQQFEQYLSENRLVDAEQLLNEMQQNYPDFDYTDLIVLLADAKDNQ